MTVGLGIFVKTPGHSPVKTRLARGRDGDFAERFHLLAARAVADAARACVEPVGDGPASVAPYWAVAEPEAADRSHWPGLPCLAQPEGALGVRMAAIHEQLLRRHDAAMLIGADSPHLQPRWLLEAAGWLSHPEPRCVIGPARDGGFWLFGSNRHLDRDTWSRVGYSRPDTAARFRDAFADAGRWATLPELTDVDAVEDLVDVHAALRALPAPHPGQSALLAWLDDLSVDAMPTPARIRTDA